MRSAFALACALTALAGCGGDDDPGPTLAAPAGAPGSADLACADFQTYYLEGREQTGDAVDDVRTLFEDALEEFDVVERADGANVRVVRGGQVVAVARVAAGKIERVDACDDFTR